MTQSETSYDVIVIGAGIIGISSALKLQSEGHRVLVLDRSGVAKETSCGNAGAFAFADIVPLATPGIMRKAPKWLLDPLGPLSIKPAYALKIIPWMLKFWRASWQDKYQAAMTAQASLMALSKAALERQIKAVNGEAMMRREGQLQLYEGEAEFNASLPGWQTRMAHGVVCELLESPEAIAKIQPGIDPRFTHGGFTPEWINTTDPEAWTLHLYQAFIEKGGRYENASVSRLIPKTDHVVLQLADNAAQQSKNYSAKCVVVAAGAWSKTLATSLGDNIPLETERGYNTTLPKGDFELNTHVTFSNHGFVVSKIGDQIRVGGAVELGGLHLKPNYKRSQVLLDKAARFLKGFNKEDGKQWMGFRPSMPDSLPVVSYSGKTDRVIYAFGHGHLGLTQSAGTAELVAALVSGGEPPIPVAPFSAKRF
ncbi:D-amino-acid dehydrogenase [Oceanospirillum multiglobuliferum]|uniref:Amino acid dehydrogenase n=1 Tax=Oceanospirillum multiglobuliferum TaxID=64969 RepID=A0A1T4MM04_9GAMM|nr:FAD-dependent oxidoreductase [Oceanospirillum multiglobuliferum]OPX56970.1 amino acid dehydrogenase [Oceanospirillum multiglobuliferum]SJZ67911.1 D-amino-acid dehydrogenase [Oceanospirillum multiglobuliferum]